MRMRKLNDDFISDLETGSLSKLLKTVKADDTLCLEIRENYINVYYRGGNLLTVTKKDRRYELHFDKKYCIDNINLWQKPNFDNLNSIHDYISSFPLLKREMDNWFSKHSKLEREFQQIILRENNFSSISNDTDYFISDIEYANSENKSRFDMVGIKWRSKSTDRKNGAEPILAIFEVKYGDGAMTGSAGIIKHFKDIEKFIDSGKIGALCHEVSEIFNQKVKLGLMGGIKKEIKISADKKPEFVLICANHKPASSILKRELYKAVGKCPNLQQKIDIRIAQSSFMGYGLYEDNMISLEEFFK